MDRRKTDDYGGFADSGLGMVIVGNTVYAVLSLVTVTVATLMFSLPLRIITGLLLHARDPERLALILALPITATLVAVFYMKKHNKENHANAGFVSAILLLIIALFSFGQYTTSGMPELTLEVVVASQFVILVAITLWDRRQIAIAKEEMQQERPSTLPEVPDVAADTDPLASRRDMAYSSAELRKLPYAEYLKTPHWQRLRERALVSAGYRCQVCNSGQGPLNVHHRTYERRGRELPSDLIVLCEKCHSLFHSQREPGT
jgi:hypothetical protein